MRLTRLIMRIAYVSTRFLCVDMEKFPPVGLTTRPPDATLAKSTRTRHLYDKIEYTFYKDYIQIVFRLLHDIKHSFIFNLTFINGFRGVFCIIVYIFALCNSLKYLYRVSYQNNGFWIVLYILLYQVNVWNTVSSSSHLRELRILHFYTL